MPFWDLTKTPQSLACTWFAIMCYCIPCHAWYPQQTTARRTVGGRGPFSTRLVWAVADTALCGNNGSPGAELPPSPASLPQMTQASADGNGAGTEAELKVASLLLPLVVGVPRGGVSAGSV